jgi:hypothetical protein
MITGQGETIRAVAADTMSAPQQKVVAPDTIPATSQQVVAQDTITVTPQQVVAHDTIPTTPHQVVAKDTIPAPSRKVVAADAPSMSSQRAVAADTLAVPSSREEFSIGSIIPLHAAGNDRKGEELYTLETGADHIPGAGRIEGQPLPGEIMSNDFGFIILSASMLLMAMLMVSGKKIMVTGLSAIGFRRQPEMAPPGTSEVFAWPFFFRNIFAILNVGLFATMALLMTGLIPSDGPSGSVRLTAILTGSFLAALMLRHLTCILAAEVTGWKELFREYMNVVYNSWFAIAILLFILNGIILFAPFEKIVPFIIAGIVIASILLIIRILRLLSIFNYRHISILYFLLYLCALEVLPVLVILKILGVF